MVLTFMSSPAAQTHATAHSHGILVCEACILLVCVNISAATLNVVLSGCRSAIYCENGEGIEEDVWLKRGMLIIALGETV